MKKNIFNIIVVIFLIFTLSGCGVIYKVRNIFRFGEKDTFEYGITAKQWFDYITTAAKEWKPDAYFYGISETEVNQDGASDKWQYLFYSPGSEKTCVVTCEAGFISLKEIVLTPLNSVENFMIDSPTALRYAQKSSQEFLEKNKNVSIVISLVGPSFESRKRANARWLIKYYGDTGILNLLVDAATGKIL